MVQFWDRVSKSKKHAKTVTVELLPTEYYVIPVLSIWYAVAP